MRSLKLGVLVCLLLAGTALGLRAQTLATATVTGTVHDPSGAAVPGAQCVLTDTSTNIAISTQTNAVGHYIFVSVTPGTYTLTVTAQGFRTYSVAAFKVTIGSTFTLDAALEVGAVRQTVQVEATAGAELQTLNSTLGTTVAGNTILSLPSINRDVTSLLLFQPMTAPTFMGTEGNTTGGQIAGSMSDQNTFLLDGGNATSDLEGDNNYVAGNRSYVGPQASIPTPIESIEEFKVNTNNMTADFADSAGAQIQMTTKRGNNAFHGSGYDYFQADWLNANSWSCNYYAGPPTDCTKPKQHQNRFGGSVGGPMLPSFLGGKTYFYVNYEGRRYKSSNSTYERQVPSATLRQGIIQIRDATNTWVPYDLATSTSCGTVYDASGNIVGPANLPCDPRGLGINPDIQKLWTQYMPMPNMVDSSGNCVNYGSNLNNVCGYLSSYVLPVKEDFVVGRIDHDFGTKWRWMTSYRYYRDIQPSTNQIDIGGFLPGDKLGTPAVASSNPLHPIYWVTGLTTNIKPSLTNQFTLNYLRDDWNWIRAGVANALWEQRFGVPGGLEVDGETTNPMGPFNFDTQNARFRTWDGHDWNYIDNLSWLRGNHLFQFGGQVVHWWDMHIRPDNVTGALTELVYQINSGNGIFMNEAPPATGGVGNPWQPFYCATSTSTNCIPTKYLGTWNNMYGMMAGFVAQSQQVIVRGGSDFHVLNQDFLKDTSDTDQYRLYYTDSWKIRPNLTINYGLEWGVQMPPYETNGIQDFLTDASGQPISFQSYEDNRIRAALAGQIYNPTIGFMPIRGVGGSPKYPFDPYYGAFSPRISAAWSPAFDSGVLNKLFGNKKTVIRGGYTRLYDRNNAVNLVLTPLLGYGFGQPIRCVGGLSNGVCTNVSHGTTPPDAFRIGVDGNTAPFATITPTLPLPAEPGVNAPAANVLFSLDNHWRPGTNDEIDFSLQREVKGGMIVEAAYVGKWTKHIYLGENNDQVPYMTTLNGQSLASAWANLYQATYNNVAAAPQPFIEAALAGSPYCKGFTSCTAAVQTQEGPTGAGNLGYPGNYTGGDNLYGFVLDLDPYWTAPGFAGQMMQPYDSQHYAGDDWSTTRGFANYQAFVLSLQKRTGHGLMLNANFTWSHSLGTPEINDEYVEDSPNNDFNLRYDYAPTPWDRKYVFNLLGTYQLPFGKGRKWLSHSSIIDRFVGGWQVAPIFTWATGTPIETYTGNGDEAGSGQWPWYSGAIPMINTHNLSDSAQNNIVVSEASDNPYCVGCDGNQDPAHGWTGIQKNFFKNPQAVYNGWRAFIMGIDTRTNDEGPIFGQHRWNLDLTISKDTRITERVGITVTAQMFNALNHMMWGDPSINLQYPSGFGTIGPPDTGQYGNTLNPSFTRIIELGLRVHF